MFQQANLSRALLVAGIIVAACASRVPIRAAVEAPPTLWCFGVEVESRLGRRGVACADTPQLCAQALSTAQRYGSIGGISRLGPCERWVSR